MAKQAGIQPYVGTVYNICFYKLGEGYYARLKSSLTGKRVKKDPAFKRTMENARLLAKASKIASTIYRKLLRSQRNRSLYQQLTGKAMKLLKQGVDEKEVVTAISGMAESRNKGITIPLNKNEDRITVDQPGLLKPALSRAAVDRSGMLTGLNLPSIAPSNLFHRINPITQQGCLSAGDKWMPP